MLSDDDFELFGNIRCICLGISKDGTRIGENIPVNAPECVRLTSPVKSTAKEGKNVLIGHSENLSNIN